jgi:hypothetical protein
MKDNAKEICKAEADGRKTVAEAEAKVQQRGTPKNQLELAEAKAEAQYNVEKAKCGDQVGDAKKACEQVAKASRDLSTAQAKQQSLSMTSSGASGAAASTGSSGSSSMETMPPTQGSTAEKPVPSSRSSEPATSGGQSSMPADSATSSQMPTQPSQDMQQTPSTQTTPAPAR